MSAFNEERVLSVHHWTDRLFSFTTTRDTSLRFSNGHFTMIGLRKEDGKPLLRAYSIASANYEEHLEFLGEMLSGKLLYYPTVTREEFRNQGRVTTLLENGKLAADLGLPPLNPAEDRVMICGSPEMLRDLKQMMEDRGFKEGNTTKPGDYVIERAFVEQ